MTKKMKMMKMKDLMILYYTDHSFCGVRKEFNAERKYCELIQFHYHFSQWNMHSILWAGVIIVRYT